MTITYYARDDKSGVGAVSMKLLDPQGGETHLYHYHDNFHTLFFVGGDAREWRKHELVHTLPVGSPPGRWGLMSIEIEDKAHNQASFNFLETVHFELLPEA